MRKPIHSARTLVTLLVDTDPLGTANPQPVQGETGLPMNDDPDLALQMQGARGATVTK